MHFHLFVSTAVSLVILLAGCRTVANRGSSQLSEDSHVRQRIKREGELAPFPESMPLLTKIAEVVDSEGLKEAIADSRTLQMLRERVRTSLFHLNFKFQVDAKDYPYEPPFKEPFPFRPTLEAIEDAASFFKILNQTVKFESGLDAEINNFPYFADLKLLFPEVKPLRYSPPLSLAEINSDPVGSYLIFQKRLQEIGEISPFPEFSQTVGTVLRELESSEFRKFGKTDPAFDLIWTSIVAELKALQLSQGGPESRLHPAFPAPYPYRKTIQTLERAVMVMDLRDRLKYPIGVNWHAVEVSWQTDTPKLLPLYHYNRYKYQLAGLLADLELVLLPLSTEVGFEDLIRQRVAPLGLLEISTGTARIDRHYNSPLDNLYHDANHVRRMWGYDQRKQEKRGAATFDQKLAIYREQDAFVKDLFTKMSPRNGEISDERNRNMRRLEQIIMFETFHETALTADQDSLLKDLLRGPATPQPFEVQIQTPVEDLESIRSFDGNLKSGADQLELRIDRPVTIRYFMDRAPGFLANVDNKLGWGFFDSVFDMKKYVVDPKFRKPIFVAEAAHRLFARLGYKNPPSAAQLTSEINDRSGQPELWNYFSMADARVISLSQIEILNVATADEIHATWRRGSAYNDRWKPASAKLIDGSIVNNKWALQKYLAEKKVPDYLHQYYKLEQDAASGEVVLYEDIRNLPNQYLADNHQGENLISAYVATSIIDRMWQNSIEFKTVAKVEKWLVVAAHMVHQAVLDRNANNARNNPEYNVPWSKLPARNKKNDLEILRVAFEQRLRIKKDGLSDETITIIKEGFSRLGLRIQQNESFGLCDSVQGVTEK